MRYFPSLSIIYTCILFFDVSWCIEFLVFFVFFLSSQDYIPNFIIYALKQISKRKLGFLSVSLTTIPFYFIQALWIDSVLYFNK